MPIKPSLQALWLADEVVPNPVDGKVTVSGIFDQITVRPGTDFTSPASLFFALRDVHGKVELTLLYVDLANNEVLVERKLSVQGTPLLTTDVCVSLPRIPVPHAGCYAWELHWENEMLGASRLEAFVTDGTES
jgi:Family of unknown function (DUF6941)